MAVQGTARLAGKVCREKKWEMGLVFIRRVTQERCHIDDLSFSSLFYLYSYNL